MIYIELLVVFERFQTGKLLLSARIDLYAENEHFTSTADVMGAYLSTFNKPT